MAKDESQMAVVRHGEVFKVIYKSPELSSVKVTIADEQGVEFFAEELISIKGFIRPYNFSELPKGDYTIRVADGPTQKIEKVHFTDRPWTARLSLLNTDERKIMIAVPHHSLSDFTIQILDNNGQMIYTEDQKIETDYAKVFNLKNLEKGVTINVINHSTGEAKSLVID